MAVPRQPLSAVYKMYKTSEINSFSAWSLFQLKQTEREYLISHLPFQKEEMLLSTVLL